MDFKEIFKNMGEDEFKIWCYEHFTVLQHIYQQTKQETQARDEDRPIATENFNLLKEYLADYDTYLEPDVFKAVLFAMNGATIYRLTKNEAVKKASQKHGVTQKEIKKWLDRISFVGDREKAAKKEFGQKEAMAYQEFKQQYNF